MNFGIKINWRFLYYIIFILIVFFALHVFFGFFSKKDEYLKPNSLDTHMFKSRSANSNPGKPQQERHKKMPGFIVLSYKHELFNKLIEDLAIVNPNNTLLRLISDNNNEYNYYLYDTDSDKAVVLYSPSGTKSFNISAIRKTGMKVPSAIFLKQKNSLPFREIDSISYNASLDKVLIVGENESTDSGIFVFDLQNTKLNFITKGENANWINNKEFIFYLDSAVQKYSLKESGSSQIWPVPDKTVDISKMFLSEDKSTLAVYFKKYEKIILLDLSNTTGSIKEIATIDTPALSFVLSPDAHFIAVLKDVEDKKNTKQINIYEIFKNSVKKLDLDISNPYQFEFSQAKGYQLVNWYK